MTADGKEKMKFVAEFIGREFTSHFPSGRVLTKYDRSLSIQTIIGYFLQKNKALLLISLVDGLEKTLKIEDKFNIMAWTVDFISFTSQLA